MSALLQLATRPRIQTDTWVVLTRNEFWCAIKFAAVLIPFHGEGVYFEGRRVIEIDTIGM